MFIIPKEIMAIITFPGIIVHEWAHKIACKYFAIKIVKVKYWGLGGAFVEHEPIKNNRAAAIWIPYAPLVINTVIALAIGVIIAALKYMRVIGIDPNWLWYINLILWYLGLTIAAKALPSEIDTKNVANYTRGAGAKISHWIFTGLNKLRFIWVDFIYALIIVAIPFWLVSNFSPAVRTHHQINRIVQDVSAAERVSLQAFRAETINRCSATGDFYKIMWQRGDRRRNKYYDAVSPFGGFYTMQVVRDVRWTEPDDSYTISNGLLVRVGNVPQAACRALIYIDHDRFSDRFRGAKVYKYEHDDDMPFWDLDCAETNTILFGFQWYDVE